DSHIADLALYTQSARRQLEIFTHSRSAQVDRLDCSGKPEADMHNVGASGKDDGRRWRLVFLHQLEISVRIGLGAIDTPRQPTANWQRVLAEACAKRQRHLPGWDYRNRRCRIRHLRRRG